MDDLQKQQDNVYIVPLTYAYTGGGGKGDLYIFPQQDVEVVVAFGYPVAGWAADFGGFWRNAIIPESYMARVANAYLNRKISGKWVEPEVVEQQRVQQLMGELGYATGPEAPEGGDAVGRDAGGEEGAGAVAQHDAPDTAGTAVEQAVARAPVARFEPAPSESDARPEDRGRGYPTRELY